MIIHVDRQFAVQVKDASDFKRFKVQVEAAADALSRIRPAVASVIAFDGPEVAWVSAGALLDWPGLKDDAAWRGGLEAMIAKARPHGWIREEPLAIKAHVEWAEAA